MIPQYRSDQQRISHLISLAELAEDEIQGHLSKHICILTSGLLENTVRGVLEAYSKKRAQPTVHRYVSSNLEYFNNPRWEKIIQELNSFEPRWAPELVGIIGEAGIDAINSVVANRHNFAHGRQTGLSLGTMKKYFSYIESFIDAMEAVVT